MALVRWLSHQWTSVPPMTKECSALWSAVPLTIGNAETAVFGQLISLYCNVRNTLVCQGNLGEADSLLVRAIDIQENALGRDHPSLTMALGVRSGVFIAQVWV